MSRNERWQQIKQCGFTVSIIQQISNEFPEYLQEAWDSFKKSASKKELLGIIQQIPALRRQAWELYQVNATTHDLLAFGILDLFEEAWPLFKKQASPSQMAEAFGNSSLHRHECWNIVRAQGTNRNIITTMTYAKEYRGQDLLQEMWAILRPRVTSHELRFVISHFPQFREEAWEDLKGSASENDLRSIIEERNLGDLSLLEAAEMLFQKNPSLTNLEYILHYLPNHKRTIRRWWLPFTHKTIETLPTVKVRAFRRLLQTESALTLGYLSGLDRFLPSKGYANLHKLLQERQKQVSELPTEKLLRKMKEEEKK